MMAAIVVELDKLRHGHAQSLKTGGHQQIQTGFEGLVEPLQLAVGLRVVGWLVGKP